MFGDTAKISRALLEIARMANEKIAAEAIDSSMAIAPNESIPTLIEIAQDRLSDQRDHAFSALKRIALKPVRDIDEFQTWWKSARSKLSEDARREAAEAAARALPHAEGYEDRRKLTTTLRTMPGGIGIVTCAPFLANSKTESMFGEDDLVEWNSTLALPFIIERLSLDGSTTRKSALDALIAVCARSPRLATICWPLIRAQLADRDSGIRRSAETASGLFSRADGIDALLDGISGRGNSEPSDSGKVLYSISARTFGFSINEPHSDQVDARRHLRGWWSGERKNFKPLAVATPSNPFAIYPGEAGKLHVLESLDDAARAVKLEAQTVATDSEISEAAFNVLLNERGADDAFWKKLIAQNRSRDRARGLLGSIGSTVLDTELTKRLVAKSDSETPLTRALIVVSLGASNDAKSAGAKALVAWLKSNAVAANDPLKRLGVLSLAMANNETESLKYLNDLVDAGLKADPPDADTQKLDDANSPYTLLRSAIVALSAREDGNAALLRLLNDSPEARIRETAARALSLRRDRSAIPGIVKALDKADRYTWMDYTYILEPLLNADDSVTLREMLDSSNKFMRAASVWLLTRQLDFGNDPQTKAKVISALNDEYNLVRYYAAEALGMRKSKAALEGLVKLLDDLDDDVKAVAAQALGELGDKEACMLASKAAALIYRIDVRWMKALAVSGDKKWLAEILKLATSNMYVEQRAGLEALSASDAADAKERILKTYHSDDETFQTVAFDLLTERGDVSLALIKDDVTAKDKSTRARALHFLIRLGSPGAKAALKDALKAEDDPGLKAMIEWGIVRGH